MKKALRHITIFFLAGVVLLSATGVSVHEVYCYCKGEQKASLSYFSANCEEKIRDVSEHGCCKADACCSSKSKSGTPCKSHSAKYFKSEVKYLFTSFEFKILAPEVFSVFPDLIASISPKSAHQFQSWENDLPPPPFGIELLIKVQSFLC
jgi:hypothetical protein